MSGSHKAAVGLAKVWLNPQSFNQNYQIKSNNCSFDVFQVRIYLPVVHTQLWKAAVDRTILARAREGVTFYLNNFQTNKSFCIGNLSVWWTGSDKHLCEVKKPSCLFHSTWNVGRFSKVLSTDLFHQTQVVWQKSDLLCCSITPQQHHPKPLLWSHSPCNSNPCPQQSRNSLLQIQFER